MARSFLTPPRLPSGSTLPTSGGAGDLFFKSDEDKIYVHDGTNWVIAQGSGGGGGVVVSDSAPSDPEPGTYWFDSTTTKSYIYYDSFWIEVGNNSGGYIVSETAPANPSEGDVWFDSTTTKSYIYYDSFWIEVFSGSSVGLPEGGLEGQILAKISDTDYDTTWIDNYTGELPDGSVTEAKIATDAVTETKIANSAVTNAKIAGVDASKVSGTTLVVDRLRGVGTGGMSLTSTTHGLQVGPTDGGNLAFDGNDIQARTNGAVNDISINRLGGDVDIGNTTTGFGIEGTKVWANGVYGNLLSTSFRSVYVSSTDTRDKLGYVSSSRETKKNIEPLAYTVEQILSIEPFQYNYKAEEDGQPKHAGFIAEDLHDAGLTGFVSYDDGKPATITYEFYVVALQQVIKDQEARISAIEARLDKLEK